MDVGVGLVLVATALLASVVAAVAGFGGAALLLPVLVAAFGVRDAIPILTVVQLIGNGSRVWLNRSDIHWPVVRWFALGAVPLAFAGGLLFATAPLSALTRLLGVFLLGMVIWRHVRRGPQRRIPLRSFALIGAAFSFFSALVGTVGPAMAPFFLAFGLVKGGYIATEAASSAVMHIVKLPAYVAGGAVQPSALPAGLTLGPVMVVGSLLGKRLVDRLPERIFVVIIETALTVVGVVFLVGG